MVHSHIDFSDDSDISTLVVFQIYTDNDISKSFGKVYQSCGRCKVPLNQSPRVMLESHPIISSIADR